MLISAGGLLALGMISLWSALEDAEEREFLAAQRATRLAAQGLRAALLDPELLTALPPQWLYEVEAGALVIPPGLRASAPEDPRHALPLALLTEFETATSLEFRGQHAEADALYAKLYADPVLSERSRLHIGLARAWLAHRSEKRERRDDLLDECGEFGENAYAQDLAGIMLLSLAAGRDIPAWTFERLHVFDDETLGALLAHPVMKNHGEKASLVAAANALRERRRTLRTAAKSLSPILAATEPLAIAGAGLILLMHPSEEGTGRGAVMLPEDFWALVDREPGRWLHVPIEGQPVFGSAFKSSTIPVLAPIFGIEPSVREFTGGTLGLPALLILLAISMVLSLHAMMRSMRKESDALRSRAEFLTTVTHELKTPLASIRLLAERLDQGRVQGEERRRVHYSQLAGEAARLTVLIDNVLDLGRMERGERVYDLRLRDGADAVREAASLFAPLAERDGIALEIEIRTKASLTRIDHGAVIQALVNVCENARKYAASGERIIMTCEECDGVLQVRVRDFGPGIDVSERERIFERFRRGHRQQHGGVPGVGIGLYLARKIMTAHGGDLRYQQPEEGPGSVFVLTLPLSPNGVAVEASS